MDASSIIAPGTDCAEYAEVAPLRSNGHPHNLASKAFKLRGENEPIPGGEFSLPENPGDFVDEIHRLADLFVVWQELLNSVARRAAEWGLLSFSCSFRIACLGWVRDDAWTPYCKRLNSGPCL